jgi:hypothetical protein
MACSGTALPFTLSFAQIHFLKSGPFGSWFYFRHLMTRGEEQQNNCNQYFATSSEYFTQKLQVPGDKVLRKIYGTTTYAVNKLFKMPHNYELSSFCLETNMPM